MTAGAPSVLLTGTTDPAVAALHLPVATLGDEGYVVRTVTLGGRRIALVADNADRDILYGAFALLRPIATGGAATALDLVDRPRIALRMLDHWDNPDGVVERGDAGRSLWDWRTLPDCRDPRHADYARANAALHRQGRGAGGASSAPTVSASVCRRAFPPRSNRAG